MANTVARSYNGGLGRSPQLGPGTEPLVRKSGRSPPEAEAFLVFGHSMEAPILPTFLQFRNEKKSDRPICFIFAKNHGWLRNWGA